MIQRVAETLYELLSSRMGVRTFLYNAPCLEKADPEGARYLLFLSSYERHCALRPGSGV